MLTYLRTSIFDSPAQTLVNTVNTVGVMGKGIAKEFKRIYPDMFDLYQEACRDGKLTIGKLQIWRSDNRWVLNFPTKTSWRLPSRLEYVERGLEKFQSTYEKLQIKSISFPPLGCGNGQLDWRVVRPLMEMYLDKLPIPVYIHDRQVNDRFVPEHRGKSAERMPRTFEEFLLDLQSVIFAARGSFETVGTGSEFQVRKVPSGLEIGAADRNILVDTCELEEVWSALNISIYSSDAVGSEKMRRAKSYLLPIIAKLPYIQFAETVQRREGGVPVSGYAAFLKRPVDMPSDGLFAAEQAPRSELSNVN